MRAINLHSLVKATNILAKSFESNAGVRAFVKNDGQIKDRIWFLCQFCIRVSILKKGAFLSSNEHGVALVFDNERRLKWTDSIRLYAMLGQKSIGWTRAIPMLRRENLIKQKRRADACLYFWMLAVDPDSKGTATIIEIRDAVFEESFRRKRDIIAETISERTLSMYIRYGFEIYDQFTDKNGIVIYFIYRPWSR
jgi:hypothetical protein